MSSFKTLTEMLKNNTKNFGNKIAFKVKKQNEFEPITYNELYEKIKELGTGFLEIGIKEFDHVGLVSENRLEWIISDMAVIHLRAADVPCSGNSSSKDLYFKLNHSDASSVILEGEKQFNSFLQINNPLPKITNIILIDKIDVFSKSDEVPEWANPVDFQENGKIRKSFEKAIKNL